MRNGSTGKGPRRDARKEREWRRTFRAFERNGGSVRDFCRGNDVAEHQFYAWRREIARRDRETVSETRRANVSEGGRPTVGSKSTRDRKNAATRSAVCRPILTPVTIIAEQDLMADDRRQDDAIELVFDGVTIRVPKAATRESLVMVLGALEAGRW